MKVSGPYEDLHKRDRARPARTAMLATAVCTGLLANGPSWAGQDPVPRVANSLGYAEALLEAKCGNPPAKPAVATGVWQPRRPSSGVAEILIDLPALPAPVPAHSARSISSSPTRPMLIPAPSSHVRHEAPPPAPAAVPEPVEEPEPASRPEAAPSPDSAPPPPLTSAEVDTPASSEEPAPPADPAVGPVACPSCGGLGHQLHPLAGLEFAGDASCASCGGSGVCVPGQGPCYTPCLGDHFLGRFFANLYECLCCPDPCYQPAWIPEANSALFVDYARPRTLTRFRWDRGWDMVFPDRAEFFWARQNLTPNRVPRVPRGAGGVNVPGGGGGPPFPDFARPNPNSRIPVYGEPSLNFNRLYLYQEIASERASFFIEQEYRNVEPLLGNFSSGFGDMNLGTKSLLVDCELMQLTFQFRTWIPTAAANKGLGTGHVALEPSLLLALRLAPETFFQGQLSEWIPIPGDPDYVGCIIHYHFSFNQVLWRPSPDMPIIGMWEFNGWSFQDGAYTDPVLGPFQKASEATYFSMGPSVRVSVCDKIDFGIGYAFSVTDNNWADSLLRAEFRILY